MRRRDFIRLIGSSVAWPSVAHTEQQRNSIRRIGLLMMYPEYDPEGQLRARAFEREIEKGLEGWWKPSNRFPLGHGRHRLGTVCCRANVASSAGCDAR